MIGKFFYNEGIRRLTIAFGQIFNNVMIQKTTSTGAVTSREKVPLAYASREKFLSFLKKKHSAGLYIFLRRDPLSKNM